MYQDIWVKGKLFKKGSRECAARYEHIKKYLNKLDKPFTVLDIGANSGYFSFRIAEDFDATVTMIESRKGIVNIMEKNNNNKVKLIHKRVNVNDLNDLAKNNHYDVVLALSFIHHSDDYGKLANAIFKLGDHVFIEPPSIDERKNKKTGHRTIGIYQKLLPKKPRILTYTKGVGKTGKKVWRPLMVFTKD